MTTLLTVRQFAAKNPAWSEASVRNLIFKSKARKSSKGEIPGNGLVTAFVYFNRKVLIHEERFFEVLLSLQEHNA